MKNKQDLDEDEINLIEPFYPKFYLGFPKKTQYFGERKNW